MPKIEEVTWILLKILFKLIDTHTSISGSVQTGHTSDKTWSFKYLYPQAFKTNLPECVCSLECNLGNDLVAGVLCLERHEQE